MNSKKPNILRILSISDVHLNHGRNPTEKIIANLDKYVLDRPDFHDLDIMFIAGDLFDQLMEHDSVNRAPIYLWFARLIAKCIENDVILRCLEGTPDHDWKQYEIFDTLKAMLQPNLDYKFIKTVTIEYIEKLGINVLYVPDEFRPKAESTLEVVKEVMASKGLEQVDYAVMHGFFPHQIPEIADSPACHNSDAYIELVKHLVFIGHVHSHSIFSKIVSQGSFDRLAHGEEDDKGFVIAQVNHKTGEKVVSFIKNHDAMIFKTIDVTGYSMEQALENIDKVCNEIPDGSNVRIKANKDHPIFSDMAALGRRHPLVWFTAKKVDQDQPQNEKNIHQVNLMYKPVNITKDNIFEMMFKRPAFEQVDAKLLDICKFHLGDVL